MIIGLCGLAGSGKDTVADFLVRDHSFVKVALADPLKRTCKEVFAFTDEQLWGPSEKRNEPDKRYVRIKAGALGSTITDWNHAKETYDTKPSPEEDIYLTPRHALQQLGTEWGRNCYKNVWVDYALRTASVLAGGGYYYDARYGMRSITTVDVVGEPGYKPKTDVVISDVRFENEVEAIRSKGGYVWKINRPGAGLKGDAAWHASEELNIPEELFSAVIHNDGTLEGLAVLTRLALEKVHA